MQIRARLSRSSIRSPDNRRPSSRRFQFFRRQARERAQTEATLRRPCSKFRDDRYSRAEHLYNGGPPAVLGDGIMLVRRRVLHLIGAGVALTGASRITKAQAAEGTP